VLEAKASGYPWGRFGLKLSINLVFKQLLKNLFIACVSADE
jgi:hypothetical protein